MARSAVKLSPSQPTPPSATSHRRADELVGIGLLVMSLALLLSLISFNPQDAAWNVAAPAHQTSNWIGKAGAYVADVVLQTCGLTAYLLPLFFLYLGWLKLRSRDVRAVMTRSLGWMACCLSLAALLALFFPSTFVFENIRVGGLLGLLVATGLASYLNTVGAALVLVTALLLMLIVTANISFVEQVDRLLPRLSQLVRRWKLPTLSPSTWQTLTEQVEHELLLDESLDSAVSPPRVRTEQSPSERTKPAQAASPPIVPSGAAKASSPQTKSATPSPAADVPVAGDVASSAQAVPSPVETPLKTEVAQMLSTATIQSRPEEKPSEAAHKAEKLTKSVKSAFILPSVNLLKEPVHTPESTEQEQQELLRRAQQLALRCSEFSVTGQVQQISPGPVVTTFEFKPDPGVKYSRITSLADDLCLALEAEHIRIDRIAGKSTVGIEVPNKHPEIIYLRELIESRKYQTSRSKLTIALGKLIDGSIYITDLARMPHLLIAGATGAGKSMTLNAIICSLLYKATPDEVRFILIDPKRLELGLYEGIPHLLTPIVMDPKRAANALKWAVSQMEDRYRLLASVGVRNIDQFNKEVQTSGGRLLLSDESERAELKPLPYIVIIIDELADLMMVASNDVETSITRLAQMARAVGIHLILTTQRPSVDVITGLIKANFPCRIAFRVASKIDSRTIIDTNGAEQLLGRGDMLFLPPGTARLVRVHGAYVDEADINAIVDFVKSQAAPEYDESILMSEKERQELAEGASGARDELYHEALKIVVQMGRASTSVLQRRLRIGYGRAASIIDAMERDGFVEPANGMKPRAVTSAAKEFYARLMEMEQEQAE